MSKGFVHPIDWIVVVGGKFFDQPGFFYLLLLKQVSMLFRKLVRRTRSCGIGKGIDARGMQAEFCFAADVDNFHVVVVARQRLSGGRHRPMGGEQRVVPLVFNQRGQSGGV